MEIEPTIKLNGSAFVGNSINSTRPISQLPNTDTTKVVSLTEWCEKNFITKRIGRQLIKRKLLIAFRRHHVWWVTANPDCIEQLLEYLGVDELQFNPDL